MAARLNKDITFPHAAQVFLIKSEVLAKRTREHSTGIAGGVASCPRAGHSPADEVRTSRGHGGIENRRHEILDHTRGTKTTAASALAAAPKTSKLRRFALSLLKHRAKPGESIASMTRKLAARNRLVVDHLCTPRNSTGFVASA